MRKRRTPHEVRAERARERRLDGVSPVRREECTFVIWSET